VREASATSVIDIFSPLTPSFFTALVVPVLGERTLAGVARLRPYGVLPAFYESAREELIMRNS